MGLRRDKRRLTSAPTFSRRHATFAPSPCPLLGTKTGRTIWFRTRSCAPCRNRTGLSPAPSYRLGCSRSCATCAIPATRKHKREVEDVDGLYAAKLSTLPEQPGCVE